MRRLNLLRAILMVMLLTSPTWADGNRIRPSGRNEAARVRVGGKLRIYHQASAAEPFEFRIQGPASIRVLSRYLYPGEPPDEDLDYQLSVEIDGVTLRILDEGVRLSNDATLEGGAPIGSLKKRVVKIPRGDHTVRVRPLGETTSVALRVFQGKGGTKKVKWVSYTPETYERAIRLQTRDSESIYYRFTAETPATLTLYGPLNLKLRTRIDFDVEQSRSQRYTVKAFLDGELARSYPLRANTSDVSVYPDLPEITPGVARDVIFEVPDGRHHVTIELDCTTAGAASLKLYIPQNAVTNGS